MQPWVFPGSATETRCKSAVQRTLTLFKAGSLKLGFNYTPERVPPSSRGLFETGKLDTADSNVILQV